MLPFNDLGYQPDDLMVKVSELMVATSDESDEGIDDSVPEVLRLLRSRTTFTLLVVVPALQVLLFGYAIRPNVASVSVAIAAPTWS